MTVVDNPALPILQVCEMPNSNASTLMSGFKTPYNFQLSTVDLRLLRLLLISEVFEVIDHFTKYRTLGISATATFKADQPCRGFYPDDERAAIVVDVEFFN